MKKYTSPIFVCSVILLLFPFISLSEFWEYLYVIIPSFIIAVNIMNMRRKLEKIGTIKETEKPKVKAKTKSAKSKVVENISEDKIDLTTDAETEFNNETSESAQISETEEDKML